MLCRLCRLCKGFHIFSIHLSVQAAMLLLIKCGVPKLSYLLRCVPPTCISAYAAEMDGQVLNCASKLLKLNDTDMKNSKIIQQLQSPISYGFGLISAVESSHVAYLSSVVSCLSMKTLKQHLSSFFLLLGLHLHHPPYPHLQQNQACSINT